MKTKLTIERLRNLNDVNFATYHGSRYIASENCWEYPEYCEDDSASFSDFLNVELSDWFDPSKVYLLPTWFQGSDYSNGRIIQASNLKAFIENHGNEGLIKLYGDYGSFGLAIRLDMLTEPMLDDLESLENYPVLDEDVMSEMELDEQQEAWNSWAAHDFERELESFLSIDIESTGERFQELFYKLAEHANEYWFEDGCDQYIRVDNIAFEATIGDLQEYGVEFIGRDSE